MILERNALAGNGAYGKAVDVVSCNVVVRTLNLLTIAVLAERYGIFEYLLLTSVEERQANLDRKSVV